MFICRCIQIINFHCTNHLARATINNNNKISRVSSLPSVRVKRSCLRVRGSCDACLVAPWTSRTCCRWPEGACERSRRLRARCGSGGQRFVWGAGLSLGSPVDERNIALWIIYIVIFTLFSLSNKQNIQSVVKFETKKWYLHTGYIQTKVHKL